MATRSSPAQSVRRDRTTQHRSFLAHANHRWLKVAGVLSLICVLAYALVDQQPRPNGGTWLGYTLGTMGALLIVWLSFIGIRKRAMTPGRWSLKGWTSAHVYLGLALIVVATLHCGFQFGWNVHTLAYALMMLVILSGIYGVIAYAMLPRALSEGRGGLTEREMIENVRVIDAQLHDAAQPLAQGDAEKLLAVMAEDPLRASVWQRLSGQYPRCATRAALAHFGQYAGGGDASLGKLSVLLQRRFSALEMMRRHMRTKALLTVWLYVHVPVTIALFAALIAHIVSVFFYW
jgi:hypothetical protein